MIPPGTRLLVLPAGNPSHAFDSPGDWVSIVKSHARAKAFSRSASCDQTNQTSVDRNFSVEFLELLYASC